MIYDYEWRGTEVRRNFGVLGLSFQTVRRMRAARPTISLGHMVGELRPCRIHFIGSQPTISTLRDIALTLALKRRKDAKISQVSANYCLGDLDAKGSIITLYPAFTDGIIQGYHISTPHATQ